MRYPFTTLAYDPVSRHLWNLKLQYKFSELYLVRGCSQFKQGFRPVSTASPLVAFCFLIIRFAARHSD
jgi:hypothetical protein